MTSTSPNRVLTKYGEGVVANENETHFWIMLDKPLKFSDQYINSIPIKKGEVEVLTLKNILKGFSNESFTEYAGEL